MITALCVCAIQSPKVLRIENYKVFIVTAFFSVFAYIWLYLVLAVITPDRVDLWEAILTLAFFVVLIVLAYMAEKNFYIRRTSDGTDEERGRS
jgi:solute carrier family 8 (sodium/calcium exchanger)